VSIPEQTRIRTLSQWRPRTGDLALAGGTLAALFAAMLPFVRVISLGWWVLAAFAVAALVFATGVLMRGLRVPAVGVTVAEAVVWVAAVTAQFFAGTAILLIIPTRSTVDAAMAAVQSALDDVQYGSAPLEPRVGLSVVIAALAGLLAIVFDHVVLTARMPLLAAVGLIALSLAPAIAVPGDFDPAAFVVLAICILFLIRTDTQLRREQGDAGIPQRAPSLTTAHADTRGGPAPARSSTTAMAAGIGAIALVVALIVTPLLPQPAARAGFGGATVSIDPSLRLGNDLRRPVDTEVLQVHTSGASAPYLRVATLSNFSGADWQPDEGPASPVIRSSSFQKVDVDHGIALTKTTTRVDVINLTSRWLPVPYPATAVANLGPEWAVMRDNRTIVGTVDTSAGQTYEITTQVPSPTSEQIRASSATIVNAAQAGSPLTASLPRSVPADISKLAHDVTAGAATDYDALLDLQNWFRGPDFTYSLLAPRAGGFDDSGVKSIEAFLQKKEGYCIHFASAFALMARLLGMHSRVVVGYLPGSASSQVGADPNLYTVTSSELHAWPEVFFQGIGWVPFDPTKGLGVPTAFAAAAAPGAPVTNPSAPTSSARTPTPVRNEAGNKLDVTNGNAAAAAAAAVANPAPWIGALVALLVVAGVPSVVGVLRRRRLLAAAREENAAAAWTYVQEAAIDIGLSVPAAESPRSFAGRLSAEHPVPLDSIGLLLAAIERASYGRGGLRGYWQGDALPDAAASVRTALLASVPARARWRAVLLPRSLFIRPGSVYAGTSGSSGAVTAR
jgi:transglutaminase-like putative cysteine protease